MTARLLAIALVLGPALPAFGQEAAPPGEEQPLATGVYARVIVDRTELRSGPGASYQRVRVAERGDTFRVVQRASTGYWFRVELPDGTFAWIHGDTVYNHQVSAQQATGGRFLPELFAPPPLPSASGEL
ncbi:MAG TPA: SH3 domain-containing protein, partial [Sandaracinaceae bacterium]